MNFGILGPYLIFPGQCVTIHAAKHRNLLAILTVNANTFVPLEWLADELWMGDPPPSAPNLIRQYISCIRRHLPGQSGSNIISTAPAGYVMHLRPGDLDRDDFDRMMEIGHTALDNGDLDAGAEVLNEALSLWRGKPLADIAPSPTITAEARRLEERKLAVTQLRIEADLGCGRHSRAVEELTALVALHPKQERPRELLMQALYRTGRRADALAVFREGREALIDGLGIEPGPALKRLHQQILSDDSALQPGSSRAIGTPEAALPSVHFPDVPDLVGRERELGRIRNAVIHGIGSGRRSAAPPVVIVSGKAGAGKSVLAVRLAYLLDRNFPDGHLLIALDDCPVRASAPTIALRQALNSLGIPTEDVPVDVDEQTRLYRARMLGKRMLITLDAATHEQQVRALTPPSPGSALIVTSRSVLAGVEGAIHIECGSLSEAEAIRMVAGIIGDQRVNAEPEETRVLVNLCERLPLALRIVGTLLVLHRRWPIRVLLTRLRTRNPLDELNYGELALRPKLTASYSLLDPVEQRVFRRIGATDDGEFDLPTAAIIAGVDISTAEQAVHRLIEMHMVEATAAADDGWGRYRLDLFLLGYARERLLADEVAGENASGQERARSEKQI